MKKDRTENKFLLRFGGINIFLLSLVSLLNDISSEMIQPILPLLITAIGGTGLAVGIAGGVIDGFPNIIKVFVGYFSDKIKKRKAFILGGYFFTQASKIGIALARSSFWIISFTGLDKIGKGIREPPRDALIAESLPKEKGRAFGIQRAFDRGGAIIGSILVLIVVIFLGSSFKQLNLIHGIIMAAAIIGFSSLIPILFLKEPKRKNFKKISFKLAKHMPKELIRFIIISTIFALASFSYLLFILKASKLFGAGAFILPVIPIMLYVIYNVFCSAFSVYFGKLSDLIGRKKVLVSGYILFAITCLGFIFLTSLASYILLFISYGLGSAMVFGNQNAMVSDLSPEKLRATNLGIFQTSIGLAAIISNLIAGYLFDINANWTFLYGFILSIISALLFVSLIKNSRANKL